MRRLLPLWAVWFAFISLISLPWIGFTTDPRWDRVLWIPFADWAGSPRHLLRHSRDFVLNVLVFVPFGYAVARRAPRSGVLLAASMAASISVCAEATQLFSTRRFPSATDVTAAVIGAVAGTIPTLSLYGASKPETWTD